MSLDRTVFKKKPILVIRGRKQFFIDRSHLVEFEAPGSRWKEDVKDRVHLCGGSYFIVDDDGDCRACKVAERSSSSVCKPAAVRVLDITACCAPSDSAPLSPGIYKRPESKMYRAELEELVAHLPPDLRRELKTTAFSADEERELLEIAGCVRGVYRMPWREFSEKVPSPWPNPIPRDAEEHGFNVREYCATRKKVLTFLGKSSKPVTMQELCEGADIRRWMEQRVIDTMETWSELKIDREREPMTVMSLIRDLAADDEKSERAILKDGDVEIVACRNCGDLYRKREFCQKCRRRRIPIPMTRTISWERISEEPDTPKPSMPLRTFATFEEAKRAGVAAQKLSSAKKEENLAVQALRDLLAKRKHRA